MLSVIRQSVIVLIVLAPIGSKNEVEIREVGDPLQNHLRFSYYYHILNRLAYCAGREYKRGEVSLYCWPPVWLVWNQLYDNWEFFIYLQNRLIQTSQTGGQQYSDTSPFSIPWRG
jgi:hypothetical protein